MWGVTGRRCGLSSAPGRRRGTLRGGPLPEVATASLGLGQACPRVPGSRAPLTTLTSRSLTAPAPEQCRSHLPLPQPSGGTAGGQEEATSGRTVHPSPLALAHVAAACPGGALKGALHPAFLTCPAPAHPRRGTHRRPAPDVQPFLTYCPARSQPQQVLPHCAHPGPSPPLQ